ncbi:hypothetical protein BH10BAC3_BH10BAC3_00790 [soil metagenome]
MKKYTTWLKTAAIVQFITTVMHAIALFFPLAPKNENEKQLSNLMDTYKFDLGAGFHRTMGGMVLALSACFSLVCLLGGLLNWYLLRKKVESEIMKGVITINLIVFGILFVLVATFAFLPPIILIGLIVLFLIFSRLTIRKNS